MRHWTLPIIGAVALSIAVPAGADARPRLGPGALLGLFAAPFGALLGARPGLAHAGRRKGAGTRERGARETPRERGNRDSAPAQAGEDDAEPLRAANRAAVSRHVGWKGAVFWPNASDDMFDYALFPAAADNRFWAYGFGDIMQGVFASAAPGQAAAAADGCGGAPAADSAERVIERITQALAPDTLDADMLLALQSALTEAGERITAACRTAMPTPPDRLDTMLERVW